MRLTTYIPSDGSTSNGSDNTRDLKQEICDTFAAFLRQKPGLKPEFFEGFPSYKKHSREVQRDRREGERLLAEVRADATITAEFILNLADDGGRVIINPNALVKIQPRSGMPYETRRVTIEYNEGQFGQLEFRGAAANFLARVLRYAWTAKNKANLPPGGDWGTPFRNEMKKRLGATMVKRWFK